MTIKFYGPVTVHIYQSNPSLEEALSNLENANEEIANLNTAIETEKSVAQADHDALMQQITDLRQQIADGATAEQLQQLTSAIHEAAMKLAPASGTGTDTATLTADGWTVHESRYTDPDGVLHRVTWEQNGEGDSAEIRNKVDTIVETDSSDAAGTITIP